MTVSVPAGNTNETASEYICAQMATDTSAVEFILSGPAASMYQLPPCVANYAYTTISLENIVLTTFSNVKQDVLESLTLTNSALVPVEDGAAGYNTDGTLNWSYVFGLLPNLKVFQATNVAVSGTIPSSLPAMMETFTLASTGLTGSISSYLLTGYSGSSTATVEITITGHSLSSGFNPAIMSAIATMSSTTSLKLDFSNNQLGGTINGGSFSLGTLNTFSLSLANNALSGGFPSGWFAGKPSLDYFVLDFSSNSITSLPSVIFSEGFAAVATAATGGTFTVDFRENLITGTMPTNILTNGLTSNVTFYNFLFDVRNNILTGSLPADLFHTTVSTKRDLSAADASLESEASSTVFIGGNWAQFLITTNSFSGTIPDNILEYGIPTSTFNHVYFQANVNQFSGSPPSQCNPNVYQYMIYIPQNQLNGSIPNSYVDCKLYWLSLEYNSALTGTIPKNLLLTGMNAFTAQFTALHGDLPTLPGGVFNINLGSTNINFCSAASITAYSTLTYHEYCLFSLTATCSCLDTYSQCTQTSCAPGIPLYEEPFTPVAPGPIAPPVKVPAPAGCPGTRPSTDFSCANGTWTAATVTTTTLVIPSGTGTVVITGSLTVSSLLISGLSSSVSVSGCATNLSDIHVNLESTEVESLGSSTLHSLISSGSNCSTEYSTIAVTTSVSGKSCRKVSVSKSTSSDGSTLSGLFTVDKSSCNTWWIIVVAVVAGVVVLTVILLIIIFACVPACREKARPYSKPRKETHGEGEV